LHFIGFNAKKKLFIIMFDTIPNKIEGRKSSNYFLDHVDIRCWVAPQFIRCNFDARLLVFQKIACSRKLHSGTLFYILVTMNPMSFNY
jgi:hypothetical protein